MVGVDYSYISVDLVPALRDEIWNVLLASGVNVPDKYPLHSTLMFSEYPVMEEITKLDPSKVFKANITDITYLGDAIVFNLYSKDLKDEFLRLRDEGYTHSYRDALPHMSLTYDFTEHDIIVLKENFRDWAGRELLFSNEHYG